MTDELESISLEELHGAKLVTNGEPIVGFTCEDYPECDICGDLPEELVEPSEEDIVVRSSGELDTERFKIIDTNWE